LGSLEFHDSEKHIFTAGEQKISIYPVHIYCPIWVKFGIRDRHSVLLSIYEFREKAHKKSVFFNGRK